MVRLLLRLFGIKDFEVCASCETLKKQLEFTNAEKRELMETLVLLTKPAIQVQSSDVKLVNPTIAHERFSRRKSILENMHRKTDEIIKTSPFIAKSDDELPRKTTITPESIEDMENKLGLNDEKVNVS